jgi:transcription-repair coupling factor (superfamily II helicase)
MVPPRFASPFKPGELIVHPTHGLSRFIGMRLLQAEDGSTAEYFQLDYAEGDRVFVPVEQVSRLTKYVGNEVALARLTAGVERRTPYSRGQRPATP